MLRRAFFKSITSSLAVRMLPRWRSETAAAMPEANGSSLHDMAFVVLPQSLGPKMIHEVTEAFQQWFSAFPAAADAGCGYGHPKPRTVGLNPSLHYPEQLKDDATSRLMQLRFVRSESTESYFEALRGYLELHGCPVAFYSDKHSVFRATNPNTKGVQSMTQFGRAVAELSIEILCANSSHAKVTWSVRTARCRIAW